MNASPSHRNRIVALYAAGSAAWIVGSDLVIALINGHGTAGLQSALKGLLFVAVTALLLHILLSRMPAQANPLPAERGAALSGSRLLTFIAAAAIIAASTGSVIWMLHAEHMASTRETLASVGRLKLELVQKEIRERKLDLDLLRDPRISDRPLVERLVSRDPADRRIASSRLESLRATVGHDAVAAFDPEGRLLLSVGTQNELTADELALALKTARDADAAFLLNPGTAKDAFMHYVAPMRDTKGELRALVIVQANARRELMQRVHAWPTPSETGEVVVAMRDGDSIHFLTQTMMSDAASGRTEVRADRPELVARKALDGASGIVEGLDYRGHPVMAWVTRLPDTPWVLIAKQDRSEVMGDSLTWTTLVAALGLAAILLAGFMLRLSWQQERMAWTAAQLREQAGRVNAERQLELATRAGGIGTFEWNIAEDRLVWNEQHARLWNTTLAAFPGTFAAFAAEVHPDDMGMLKAEIAACRKDGREFAMEFRVRRPEGGTRWISARGQFVDDPPDRPGRMYGTVQDVSRVHEEQDERARLLGLLQSIIEGSTDAIYMKDLQGRYLVANAAALAAFGRTEAAVLGRTDVELLPQHDARIIMERDRAIVEAGKVVTTEQTFEVAMGVRTYLSTNGPTRDQLGRITGTYGISRDVTERVRIAAAISESELRYRMMFTASPQPMWVADAQTFRIVEVNDAAVATYGYPRDEFVGMELAMLRPPEDRERFREHLAGLKDGLVEGGHWRHLRRDGSLMDVVTRSHNFDWNGQRAWLVLATDVTEQEKAARALAESEARYRVLFHDNPHPMWVFDTETLRILAVNDMALARYGYTREEFLAMTIRDLRPAEDLPRLEAHIASHHGEAQDAGYWRHKIKDGSVIDVAVAVHGMTWDGRSAKAVLSVDVTAQRKAEAELRDALQMLELTVEGGEIGTWDWDLPSGRTSYNARWARMLGYEAAELEPHVSTWEGMVHPEDLAGVKAKVQACIRGETPAYESEHRLRHKDGHWVWVLDKGKVTMHDTSGRAVRLSGTHLDISQRKRTEAVMAEERAQLRSVVDQTISGMYVVQDGKMVFVNQRYAEILGYDSPEQVAGLAVQDLVAPESLDVAGTNIRRRLAGEVKSVAYELTLLRRDGSRVEVEAHGSTATWHGRPAIVGILQDISDRKRAEAAIARYIKQIEEAFLRTVEVASALSEMRDPYTAGHERRVAELAVAIGRELGQDDHQLEGLRVAGMLHDIGKILVPAEILAKPGRLSQVEYELVKGHVDAGYEVLKNVDFPWPVADMVRQHHERLDGTGYPLGLKGDQILPQSRIMAVADTVEAMSSHRPYRPGLGIEPALKEIERGRGAIYDPLVVDACLRLFRDKGYVIPA